MLIIVSVVKAIVAEERAVVFKKLFTVMLWAFHDSPLELAFENPARKTPRLTTLQIKQQRL